MIRKRSRAQCPEIRRIVRYVGPTLAASATAQPVAAASSRREKMHGGWKPPLQKLTTSPHDEHASETIQTLPSHRNSYFV